MKLLFVVSAIICGCLALSDDAVLKQWKEYQEKFQKSYKSPLEVRKRFSIFRENLKQIESHNIQFAEGKETYQKGLTKFADWSPEEFSHFLNNFRIPDQRSGDVFEVDPDSDVPDSIDWRVFGAVTQVRDQGNISASWTFSCAGALEGAAHIYKEKTITLSEQNLLDCVTDAVGSMDGGFNYVEQNGIQSEDNYRYEADEGTCRQNGYVFKISGHKDVPQSEDALKEAVGTIGPVSVGIQATLNLQLYVSGVLYDPNCSGENINHAMLVVGYDKEDGKDFWRIKNSWGHGWGENGYLKLARNRGNNCNVANMASYPIV